MAVAPILPVLLLVVVTRCRCDPINGYDTHNGNSAAQYSTLLKPPPLPLLSHLVPVPFHRNSERNQHQNVDNGYQYRVPSFKFPNSQFKFPAPFYKQYNFNFVPPPQPFSTTPSPSMFQKVTGWLFPSQQTNYAGSTIFNNNNNVTPIKKDCNPCNLVPWLPVIKYNVGAKSVYQNYLPTYGPPSATADALHVTQKYPQAYNSQNQNTNAQQMMHGAPHASYGPPSATTHADTLQVTQKYPESFNLQNQNIRLEQASPGVPHANYGLPAQKQNNVITNTVGSTYGPPSDTYTLDILPPNPPSTNIVQPNYSYESPNTPLSEPIKSINSQPFGFNTYNTLSSTYKPPSLSYGAPSIAHGTTPQYLSTTYISATHQYDPGLLNKELPHNSDVEIINNVTPKSELQLPNNAQTTVFKNSYGEPLTNKHLFDIPYPVSATAAESSKIKTTVLPQENKSVTQNVSFALGNPAPFTINRGRNIHTLQPVALPNLSVSPLPPIFNARPFRPIQSQFPKNILESINQMQQSVSNVDIQQSIPLTEFTHSVDYPPTVIQSPVIEIEAPVLSNQTKGYRNIPNSYLVDEIRDISSQASEDHISATKSISDASFESTGFDVGNDLYDSKVPPTLMEPSPISSNHKPNFADLRGLSDEELDKYRTESNLQNIDSPLLYLKPNIPHKNHGNFIFAISSTLPENDYEIYDDSPTTNVPQTTSLTSNRDESRTADYNEELSAPSAQENVYKPKIVQIIVPYTTGTQEKEIDVVQMAQDWPSTPKDEYQARKVPSYTGNNHSNKPTEDNTEGTTPEYSHSTIPENGDAERFNPTDTLRDLYDVEEPPFDIIKLQHTIDDWTEQEYSKKYKTLQRTRNNENYAKKIPDDYFTTTMSTNYVTTISNYDYDPFDHEGSSSIQHSVTDNSNNETIHKPRKQYNTIEISKNKFVSGKNEELAEVQKLHIYTAASSFRITSTSTTTTPAPWGKIQTSISPLTKEKVYVVTSKPWKDLRNTSKEWFGIEPLESKKTYKESESSASNNFPFKSPRFINRPSFGFTSGGKIESDASYAYSKNWYQSINELEIPEDKKNTTLSEFIQRRATYYSEEVTSTTTNPREISSDVR